MIQQHFVVFYSPGTLMAETTERSIESWDIEIAKKMAYSIKERYGATPYGFRFTTRGRSDKDLDSHVIAESNFYFLGGKVETLAEVKARATAKDRILVSNMETNNYEKIITNDNSWRWTQPFRKGDVILDFPLKELANVPER